MTKIELSYNPFFVKTELKINGDEIAKTSNLYRYRNTPLEDWVDVLIPELIDYCNDDILKITMRSVEKYLDEVQKQISDFLKSNIYISIEFEKKISVDYDFRLNKLAELEKKYNDILDDGYEHYLSIDVYISSIVNSVDYEEVLNTIFKDTTFYVHKRYYSDEEILNEIKADLLILDDLKLNLNIYILPSFCEDDNRYREFLQDRIDKNNDFICVSVLDSKPNYNDDFLKLIETQITKKGKLNKSRFIFISENSEGNKEYIRDEYGVKLDKILNFDDAYKCLELVRQYVQCVGYVKKISKTHTLIKNRLEYLQVEMSKEYEKRIGLQECENIKEDFKKRIDYIQKYYRFTSIKSSGQNEKKEENDQLKVKPVYRKGLFGSYRYIFFYDNVRRDISKEIVSLIVDNVLIKTADKFENNITSVNKTEVAEYAKCVISDFRLGKYDDKIENVFITVLTNKVTNYLTDEYTLSASTTEFPYEYMFNKEYKIGLYCNEIIEKKVRDFIYGLFRYNRNYVFSKITDTITSSDLMVYNVSSYKNYKKIDVSSLEYKISDVLSQINMEHELRNFFGTMLSNKIIDEISMKLKDKRAHIDSLIEGTKERFYAKYDEMYKLMEDIYNEKKDVSEIEKIINELDKVIEL